MRLVLKLCGNVQCKFLARGLHSSAPACTSFYESHIKAGYQKPDDRKLKETIRDGLSQLKTEIKVWKQEVKDTVQMDIPMIRPGKKKFQLVCFKSVFCVSKHLSIGSTAH